MYKIIFHFTSGNSTEITRRAKQHAQLIEQEINAAHEMSGNMIYKVAKSDKAEKLCVIFISRLEYIDIDLVE